MHEENTVFYLYLQKYFTSNILQQNILKGNICRRLILQIAFNYSVHTFLFTKICFQNLSHSEML